MVRFHLAPHSGFAALVFKVVFDMWKKLFILAGLVGAAVYVARKVKTANEERALWHEATTAPDLR
jgi:uncharacterized membrane protein YjjB (DUF3815 family)